MTGRVKEITAKVTGRTLEDIVLGLRQIISDLEDSSFAPKQDTLATDDFEVEWWVDDVDIVEES